jgi:hypothetical protein
MKFNIDIYFFDKFGRKTGEALDVPPEKEDVTPDDIGVQYVVECLPRKGE